MAESTVYRFAVGYLTARTDGFTRALFTVIAAAAPAWFAMRSARPLERLELVSGLPGLYRSPSLSPDGRAVAFVGDRSGTPQIWVKSLAGGDPLPLTFHDRSVARPRWRPTVNESFTR